MFLCISQTFYFIYVVMFWIHSWGFVGCVAYNSFWGLYIGYCLLCLLWLCLDNFHHGGGNPLGIMHTMILGTLINY
jgi:hypothetical protein